MATAAGVPVPEDEESEEDEQAKPVVATTLSAQLGARSEQLKACAGGGARLSPGAGHGRR